MEPGEWARKARCLDVAPPNVASKYLLECAGALQKSRQEHDNEKWQQELSRLHDDCAVALHKSELNSVR
jgi:hypothetical protein